jgi:hypothetical protein
MLSITQQNYLASAKKIIISLQHNQPIDLLELSKFDELYQQIFKICQNGTVFDENYLDLYTIITEIASGIQSYHIDEACDMYNEIIYNERTNASNNT